MMRREFACAIKRMVDRLLSSLEHLHSWFIAERGRGSGERNDFSPA
jgi:hypothetical protein